MKKLLLLMVVFVSLGFAGMVTATTVTTTFTGNSDTTYGTYNSAGEFSSVSNPTNGTAINVGEFTFSLAGETISSALISGLWGNSAVFSTTYTSLGLGDSSGPTIALVSSGDYEFGQTSTSPWSYNFDTAAMAALEDLTNVYLFATPDDSLGDLSANPYAVRFTLNSFEIETTTEDNGGPISSVPEPATILLVGIGMLGLAANARKK